MLCLSSMVSRSLWTRPEDLRSASGEPLTGAKRPFDRPVRRALGREPLRKLDVRSVDIPANAAYLGYFMRQRFLGLLSTLLLAVPAVATPAARAQDTAPAADAISTIAFEGTVTLDSL